METIEENKEKTIDTLVFNEEVKVYVLEITKWTKFLSILGFIGISVMAAVGIFMLFDNHRYGYAGLIFLIINLIYFIPINYLLRFALNTKEGVEKDNQNLLIYGISSLKSHYKFVGIMAIVVLSFYGLVIIATMLKVFH
ncbi:MAG: hypothetical protein WCJ03_08160 [Bacteroidales bacterium]